MSNQDDDSVAADDIQRKFGQRVRKLRQQRGLTQVVLAEQLGLSQSYLADLERGNRNVSLVNIEIIAKGLKVTLSQLFSKL